MATKKLTNETFIERSKSIHGDLYDYSLVDYKNSKEKVKIICPIHGEFQQIPNNHLKGSGCKVCGKEAQAKTLATTAKSEFETKASIVHNNKYSYELVDYKHSHTKVKITCPIHGSFLQSPTSHLNGSGCTQCGNKVRSENTGWTRTNFKDKCIKNNDSLGILYILGCWDDEKKETFIKIGITSRSIKQRYGSKASMPYNFKVLHEIIGSPEFIYDLETLLHKKSCNYKYTPITSFAGHATECFEADLTYLEKLNNHLFNLIPF